MSFNREETAEVFLKGIASDTEDDGCKASRALIFCDIDGVLLDCSHRLSYLKNKEYDKFYGCSMANDEKNVLHVLSPLIIILGIIQLYGVDNTKLVFNTGRPERTRKLTTLVLKEELPGLMGYIAWMYPHHASNDYLLMRPDDNFGPASGLKLANAARWVRNNMLDRIDNTDCFVLDDDLDVLSNFDANWIKEISSYGVWIGEGYLHTIAVGERRTESNSSEKNK